MATARAVDSITGNEIDHILDEIEEREKESHHDQETAVTADWERIRQEIKNKNVNFIKNLITAKDVDIDAQNPEDGKTLLIYAVIIGDVDLVTALCNFGANSKTKDHDGMDALDHAMKYGIYKITELVYFRSMSSGVGNDLKNISKEIHRMDRIAAYMKSIMPAMGDRIVRFVMQAIKDRAPFEATMLFYAWYFAVQSGDPFEHELWKTMMSAYEAILANTSDKAGWKWLKEEFVNSYIWFMPHPKNSNRKHDEVKDEDDDAGKMDAVLRETLFYELLYRVRAESKKQSDLLLKEKIDAIKSEQPGEWQQLIAYNVDSKHARNARQDLCGCLTPKHSESDLSEERYPPSTHFSAKKHYDTNMYLNELLFVANVMDSSFQFAMKRITEEINQMAGGNEAAVYRAGPVKTLVRSQAKVENDYINEAWPTSAKILDINRCAIQFHDIAQLMKYLELFTAKIEKKEAGCIQQVIRCKNGWSVYDEAYPQYTDVKLNVLVQTQDGNKIIAEIQFLLDLMSAFKKKAHKLYAVERKFELVYNYALLTKTMSEFKDLQGTTDILRTLVLEDNVDGFRNLWENSHTNFRVLTAPYLADPIILRLLLPEHDQIHTYLIQHSRSIYAQSVISTLLHLFSTAYQPTKYGIHRWQYFLGNIFNQLIRPKFETQPLLRDELTARFMTKMFDVLGIQKPSKKSISLDEWLQYLRPLNVVTDPCMFLRERKAFDYYALSAPHHGSVYNETQFKMEMRALQFTTLYTGYASNDAFGNVVKSYAVPLTAVTQHTFSSVSCGNFVLGIDLDGNIYSWSGTPSRSQGPDGVYNVYDADFFGIGGVQNYIQRLEKAGRKNYEPGKGFPIMAIEPFCKSKAVQVIAVEDKRGLVLCQDGTLYGFGKDDANKFGHKDANRPQLIEEAGPLKLSEKRFAQIAAGWGFNAGITDDGLLYVWGALNDEDEYYRVFGAKEEFGNGVAVQVECSRGALLVLSSNGQCFIFGRNSSEDGLGLGYTESERRAKLDEPRLVALPAGPGSHCVDVAAGWSHFLCVTASGEVWSFGGKEYGKLGRGKRGEYSEGYVPTRIEELVNKQIKIVSCWAGYDASAVISSKGEVFMFGRIPCSKELFSFSDSEQEHNKMYFEGGRYKCTVYIPTRIDAHSDSCRIVEISFGDQLTMMIAKATNDSKNEQEEEQKETVYYLDANQQRRIKMMRTSHHNKAGATEMMVYAKNEQLLPDSEWNLLSHRVFDESEFHGYSSAFIDNLQMTDEQEIVLKNAEEIAVKYHTEILQSKYVLLNGNECVIDARSVNVEQVQLFESVKDIRLKAREHVEDKAASQYISVYHQAEENGAFILLKSFKRK